MTDNVDLEVKTGYQNDVAYQNSATYTDGLNSTPWDSGITTDDTTTLFFFKQWHNSGLVRTRMSAS